MSELHEILEEVEDEESFLDFVKALISDRAPREGNLSNEVGFTEGWANNTISEFLESAVAWADDSEFGVRLNKDLEWNKWKQFAAFLYCGKIYE